MTKFLLDSGNPKEYRQISNLARQNKSEIWGGTTNPTLIAKKLAGKKLASRQEAFQAQREIVLEIISMVPGAVSVEVYADEKTTSDEMINQGLQIATWHKRVAIKLPTTIEGFKARTELRKKGILTNNTLVFSQQQVFAICLHERLIVETYNAAKTLWPAFISPFVGRLDDIGENGIDLVINSMKIKQLFPVDLWILEASVRTLEHVTLGINVNTELITASAKVYQEWFPANHSLTPQSNSQLAAIPYWNQPSELLEIKTLEEFFEALVSKRLDISHPLTDKGLVRFAQDWNAIIS